MYTIGFAMYLLIATISLCAAQVLTEVNLACRTPYEEPGQCVPIASCPVLFKAFTNPRKESENLLYRFMCGREDDEFMNFKGFATVCCGTLPNFTVYSNNLAVASNKTPKKKAVLSDRRYCGLQHRDYISSDENISIDEFPWMASVIVHYPGMVTNYTRCSGALINNRYVLTAAECIIPIGKETPMFVRLGDFHVDNDTDCVDLKRYDSRECNNAEDYYVEERILHPLYIPPDFLNNIALLRLKKGVTYSDYVRPICLPITGITLAKPNDTLHISGLGKIQGEETKKKIPIRLISDEECRQRLGPGEHIVHPNLMCTVNIKDEANLTCYGDEGSPLMVSHRHQWHMEGIVLKSYCLFSDVFKDLLLYTKVSQYLGWIEDNMRL